MLAHRIVSLFGFLDSIKNVIYRLNVRKYAPLTIFDSLIYSTIVFRKQRCDLIFLKTL